MPKLANMLITASSTVQNPLCKMIKFYSAKSYSLFNPKRLIFNSLFGTDIELFTEFCLPLPVVHIYYFVLKCRDKSHKRMSDIHE